MFCRPVGALTCRPRDPGPLIDGVVHVKLVARPRRPPAGSGVRAAAMSLPGLVGSGAAWRRACRAAEASYERGEWLALEGEHGVGKLALVRAVHQRHNPAAPCHVLDAADAAARRRLARPGARRACSTAPGCWSCGTCTRSAHGQVRALSRRPCRRRRRPAGQRRCGWRSRWTAAPPRADLTGLLRLFPGTVEVPPLRHHGEDLRELVPFFLGKLSQQGRRHLLARRDAAAAAAHLAG